VSIWIEGILKQKERVHMFRIREKTVSGEQARKKNYPPREGRVIAVTSGKGGVGTTNVVVNLALALTLRGEKVLVLDADVGLANIDILLGLNPPYNLNHVLRGEKKVSEVVVTGPGGMKVIPAGLGVQELTNLTTEQRILLLSELAPLGKEVDIFLIDTGAGISSNVIYFNLAAQENLVITSPEPTSITDAYALMKILSVGYAKHHFKLLINSVKDATEAKEVYQSLSSITEKFLDLSLDYWGYVLYDQNISRAVKHQKIAVELYPNSCASQCFFSLAKKICNSQPGFHSEGGINFFWNSIFRGYEAFNFSIS
jgi:flagellar biosynthesis protein FlhG